MSTLKQVEVEKYTQALEDISEKAQKEYSNEKTLNKMKGDWEPMDFTTKVYKESFILDGEAVELI